VRTSIKKVVNAIDASDKPAAEAAYKLVVPAIDRSVAKGIMPKNKAARHKSRLNKHIRKMA
jgi:small subunit ribosomal protein S20